MRLRAGQLETLYYAALLHSAVTAMPPPLVDHRPWRHANGRHRYDPVFQLTEGVDCLREAREILGYSDERSTGNGRSNGSSQPAAETQEAKTLTVADALTTMAADEPRTHPLTVERVRGRLSAGSWRELDQQVMKVALSSEARAVLDAFFEQAVGVPAKQRDAVIAKATRRLRRQLHAWTPPPEARRPFGPLAWFREHSWTLVSGTAVVLMTLLVFVGLVIAGRRSLPGDPLYAFKLTTEDIQLVVTSRGGELGLHEDFAQERLREIEAVRSDGERVPNSLLGALDHETLVLLQYLDELQGEEQYQLALRLEDFAAESRVTLQRVQERGKADETGLIPSIDTASLAALFAELTIGEYVAPAAAPTEAAPATGAAGQLQDAPTAAAPGPAGY